MKIHIETDTDAPHATRVTLDGVDVTPLLESANTTFDGERGAVTLVTRHHALALASPERRAALIAFQALPEPGVVRK